MTDHSELSPDNDTTTSEKRDTAMTEVHATTEFGLIWQNDQDVYNATLDYARGLLARTPGMTDQTLGRNVKDRLFSWAYGGGYGFSSGWGGATAPLLDHLRYPDWPDLTGPPVGYRASPFSYFLPTHAYGEVSEEAIAEDVREALGLESDGDDTLDGGRA